VTHSSEPEKRAQENACDTVRIDVLSWLSKATLDIIGLAGFSYPFNSLSSSPGARKDELNEAFATMFESGRQQLILGLINRWIPISRLLVSRSSISPLTKPCSFR
jgi:hypothetical protein